MGAIVISIGYAAAWVWVVLPAVYWYTAPEWWKTRTGRALMWLLGATAALFLMLLTGQAFGMYPGREIVQGIIFSLTLGAGIRLAVLFFQLRNDLYRKYNLAPPQPRLLRKVWWRIRGGDQQQKQPERKP